MSKTTVKITGLKELEANLASLKKSTAKSTLRRVLKKNAAPLMQEEWKRLAPVKTGKYRDNILIGAKPNGAKAAYARTLGATGNKEAARAAASAAKRQGGSAFVEIAVGAAKKIRAAIPQEFGTVDMAANPSARPAWDKTQMPMFDQIADNLGEAIQKSIKRAAKKASK